MATPGSSNRRRKATYRKGRQDLALELHAMIAKGSIMSVAGGFGRPRVIITFDSAEEAEALRQALVGLHDLAVREHVKEAIGEAGLAG